MSYTPATKLSHSDASQRATVLTNGNVMVTHGLGVGQIMKFADWQILADGAKIKLDCSPSSASGLAEYPPRPVEYPPVAVDSSAHSTDIVTTEASLAHAANRWAAARWTIPRIGAKLRWTLNPTNYRVAIMTAKGVLQVKSVTDGVPEIHPTTCRDCTPCRELAMTPPAPWAHNRPIKKTMFPDEAAWRASLPAGGSVDVLQPSKVAEVHADETAKAEYNSLTDIEKVNALVKRYKIRDRVQEMQSVHERLSEATNMVSKFRTSLNTLTLHDILNGDGLNRCMRLKGLLQYYRQCKSWFDAAVLSRTDVNKHALRDNRRGTGHILATINGVENIITPYNDKIAAIPLSERWSNAKTYSSFAEMGNPALSVRYRGHTINI